MINYRNIHTGIGVSVIKEENGYVYYKHPISGRMRELANWFHTHYKKEVK